MIKHLPDQVDEVKLEYEGQRRVVKPGFMTSADILRNMLLSTNGGPTGEMRQSAPIITQRQTVSLKQRLLTQQHQQHQGPNESQTHFAYSHQAPPLSNTSQHLSRSNQNLNQKLTLAMDAYDETFIDHIKQSAKTLSHDNNKARDSTTTNVDVDEDEEELSKKFRKRTRSMSGVLNLDTQITSIIDIDLDYEPNKPVQTAAKPTNEIKPVQQANTLHAAFSGRAKAGHAERCHRSAKHATRKTLRAFRFGLESSKCDTASEYRSEALAVQSRLIT
jgi:hypothetical protein